MRFHWCFYRFYSAAGDDPAMAESADRQAYYGETHVHTKLSFDAFIFGNRNGPDEAIVLPRARKYSTLPI